MTKFRFPILISEKNRWKIGLVSLMQICRLFFVKIELHIFRYVSWKRHIFKNEMNYLFLHLMAPVNKYKLSIFNTKVGYAFFITSLVTKTFVVDFIVIAIRKKERPMTSDFWGYCGHPKIGRHLWTFHWLFLYLNCLPL